MRKKRDEWCLVAREKEEGIPIETRDPTKKRDRFFSLSRTVFSKFDFQGRRFFIFFFFSLSILEIVREIVRVWIVQNRRDRCEDRTGVFLSGVLFSL